MYYVGSKLDTIFNLHETLYSVLDTCIFFYLLGALYTQFHIFHLSVVYQCFDSLFAIVRLCAFLTACMLLWLYMYNVTITAIFKQYNFSDRLQMGKYSAIPLMKEHKILKRLRIYVVIYVKCISSTKSNID